jgi:hypothetical protein
MQLAVFAEEFRGDDCQRALCPERDDFRIAILTRAAALLVTRLDDAAEVPAAGRCSGKFCAEPKAGSAIEREVALGD